MDPKTKEKMAEKIAAEKKPANSAMKNGQVLKK